MSSTLRVKLGNLTMDVPIHRDEETTLALVARINERLAEIETNARVIDTQQFALLAAYAFAVEAGDHADEVAEMAAAFKDLDAELARVLREIENT